MKSSIHKLMFLNDVHVKIISLGDINEDIVSRSAYLEAKRLATELYGNRDWTIEKDSKGKPFFANNKGYFFSVSHTEKMVVIAMCKGKSIGVDIETIHKISDKVIKKYYSNIEKESVFRCGRDVQKQEVKIWTLKESHCKCTGTGLDKYSLRWDSINQNEMELESRQIENYIVSVCKSKQKIIGESDERKIYS